MDADVPVVESGGKTDFQYGSTPRLALSADESRSRAARRRRGQARRRGARRASDARPHEGLHDVDDEGAGRRQDATTSSSSAAPTSMPATSSSTTRCIRRSPTDYERMFRVLKSLPCDIFLGAHGGYFDMEAKYARLKDGRRGRHSSIPRATRNTSTSASRRFATSSRSSRTRATQNDSLVGSRRRRWASSRGRTDANAAARRRAESVADGGAHAGARADRAARADGHEALVRRAVGKPVEVFVPATATRGRDVVDLVIHFPAARACPSKRSSRLGGINPWPRREPRRPDQARTIARSADPAVFDSLLAGVTREVAAVGGHARHVRPVTLVGFSAGHGAVRAILREPRTSRASTPCCCSMGCTRRTCPRARARRTAGRSTPRTSSPSRTMPAKRCGATSDSSSRTRRSFPGRSPARRRRPTGSCRRSTFAARRCCAGARAACSSSARQRRADSRCSGLPATRRPITSINSRRCPSCCRGYSNADAGGQPAGAVACYKRGSTWMESDPPLAALASG